MIDIRDPATYIERFLKIKNKQGKIVPLRLNAAQRRLNEIIEREEKEKKPVRIIILKARQLGFSTFAEARVFQKAATREGVNAMVIAHREDSTAKVFGMTKLFYDELPIPLKPMKKALNAQELRFENPTPDAEEKARRPGLRSGIRCVTAGGKGIGRSDTLTAVHISEYAFWPGDKAAQYLGIMQAVPALPGTMVIVESTANGFEEFQKLWTAAVRGENDFTPVFFPWTEEPGYRMRVPPGFTMTPEEKALKKRYALDDEQIVWRRWCVKNNCAGDERAFRQEYPINPDEAFVTSGRPVFDNDVIARLRERLKPPICTGDFAFDFGYTDAGPRITDIKFNDDERGDVKIYAKPEEGKPYVIGGDTAGDGSDWFTAQVLDNTTGQLVATLRRQFDEDLYAREVYCLGKFYNDALVAVESNFSSFPTAKLDELGYRHQYVRESVDDYTHALKKSFGFRTTNQTRPVIIAGLVELMRENPALVTDYDTLGEMLTFAKNEDGKAEAVAGEHDDLVMALAIAHYARPQQRYTIASEPPSRKNWTADMKEDYAAASREERIYLLKKWGGDRK